MQNNKKLHLFSKIVLILSITFVVFIFGSAPKIFAGRVVAFPTGIIKSVDLTLSKSYKTIRIPDAIITDSGRFNQQYDLVDEIYNPGIVSLYDYDKLRSEGYKTMGVTISMSVCEIDDGYQWIFIYGDTTASTLLRSGQFEHGPGKKLTTGKTYLFYFEIDMADRYSFIIRYGASGSNADSWKSGMVSVQIGWSKESVITTSMWNITGVFSPEIMPQASD